MREDAEDKSGHSVRMGVERAKLKLVQAGMAKMTTMTWTPRHRVVQQPFPRSGGLRGRWRDSGNQGRCSLQGGLLEAHHTVLSGTMMPTERPFHEIEKWRSSIAV